jgi:hypothetical protein
MIYFCCDERRRAAVRSHATLNGIDFLEVVDSEALPLNQRQRTLIVTFIKPLAAGALTKDNLRIEGGERIRDVAVVQATIGAGADANRLTVEVDEPGDFSIYTLRLVQAASDPGSPPPSGFDPLLSAVDFSFKINCPSDFDCKDAGVCPVEPTEEPELDYLAKDYASFRQLMLDRMAALMPTWRERNTADVGVTLVELLAYIGDHLSYRQDAIATEAYLGTARLRTSARRHARLVDYFMHDGCNARAWVQVQLDPSAPASGVELKRYDELTGLRTRFFTRCVAEQTVDEVSFGRILAEQRPEVFEPLHDIVLYPEHNTLGFYTWGAERCCLPEGATKATLHGSYPNLKPGDVLIFREVVGPETGQPQDADPAKRHAVRLTRAAVGQDPLGGRFLDPPTDDPVDVTEIEWGRADALPFPVCLSSLVGSTAISDVSVALGNIVLADHGLTIPAEDLGTMPAPSLHYPPVRAGDRCETPVAAAIPPRFRPQIQEGPLTQAAAFDPAASSAAAAMRWTMRQVMPAITLASDLSGQTATWRPRRDLLASHADDTDFVVEVEADGASYVRFGDDLNGLRPASGTTFEATYRVGNGTQGNVGAGAIAHVVCNDPAIVGATNPLPAHGGAEPESIEDVRQRAPYAFRTQERAVTPEDYAEVAQRHPEVQRAAATFRWTGSWRTVFLTVDRLGGGDVDATFEAEMRRHLERYRMAGYDVEIDGPRYVSLEIELHVCVLPAYFRSDVRAALLQVFSRGTLPDGQRGVFHPDNLTFGQTVYLSRIVAAAQAVPGVASVDVVTFQRRGGSSKRPLAEGKLDMGRLEIARCDNDPNFPERGSFGLTLEGGK